MNSPRVVDLDHPWVLVHLSDVHIPPQRRRGGTGYRFRSR